MCPTKWDKNKLSFYIYDMEKSGGEKRYESGEIRIRRISRPLKKQLLIISKNLGIPLSSMIKSKLQEIANSYSENMKTERKI